MTRRHNFQNLSWFHDLYQRKLLDLDPPYQRRSVWNQAFKDYFIETVLLQYPSPAIFLYENITPEGRSWYHVVDGKQRLTTLFEFVSDLFPVSERSPIGGIRGEYFSGLSPDAKKSVWGYQFLVEYVPTDDIAIIDSIFDRLNRNVAKLSAQELRHARFDGIFIKAVEDSTEWMFSVLPHGFPRLTNQSRRQMKDVEIVSTLMLLLEIGPRGLSVADLDRAFAERDEDWERQQEIEGRFRSAIQYINDVLTADRSKNLLNSRFRNQADFYSLVGAVDTLIGEGSIVDPNTACERLSLLANDVDDGDKRSRDERLEAYFSAARSASNDKGPREVRISYIRDLLAGR